jgi:hypothetical protein
MARQSLQEWISSELRYALDDIRQKVVENPWFGREVTPESVHVPEPEDRDPGTVWGCPAREKDAPAAHAPEQTHEHAREGVEHER